MPEPRHDGRDPLTERIIGAAIEVHRNLGPGLLESIYGSCLSWELRQRCIMAEQQVPLSVTYKGMRLRNAYRLDLIVEQAVIVELKAVDHLPPLIDAQVLTYLKLTGLHTALIINFNAGMLRDGVRRLVL